MWFIDLLNEGILLLIFGSLTMALMSKKIMGTLILLETSFLLMFLSLSVMLNFPMSGVCYMIFLGFAVCEAVLGLSILIFLSRKSDTQFIKMK